MPVCFVYVSPSLLSRLVVCPHVKDQLTPHSAVLIRTTNCRSMEPRSERTQQNMPTKALDRAKGASDSRDVLG